VFGIGKVSSLKVNPRRFSKEGDASVRYKNGWIGEKG
jgi:hypothetical protein